MNDQAIDRRACDDCTINNGMCHEGQCRVD